MGWRSESFIEVQTQLLAEVAELKTVELYNNQFQDWKAESNKQEPFKLPCVLLEYVGGEWEHDGYTRRSLAYNLRLHIGLQEFRDSSSRSSLQAQALAHLDFIDGIANALDAKDFTYLKNIRFIREIVDVNRTHLIHHILDFTCMALDQSLEVARACDQQTITATEQNVNIDEIAINPITNQSFKL